MKLLWIKAALPPDPDYNIQKWEAWLVLSYSVKAQSSLKYLTINSKSSEAAAACWWAASIKALLAGSETLDGSHVSEQYKKIVTLCCVHS